MPTPSSRGEPSTRCARTRSGFGNRSRDARRRKGSGMNTASYQPDTKNGGIGEALQANWVPLSLIGVGIAWLVASNTGLAERLAHDERLQAAGRRIGEFAGELGIGGDDKDGARSAGQILGP